MPAGVFNKRKVRNSEVVKPELGLFRLDFEPLYRVVIDRAVSALPLDQCAVVHEAGLRTASTTCLIASLTSCGSWA